MALRLNVTLQRLAKGKGRAAVGKRALEAQLLMHSSQVLVQVGLLSQQSKGKTHERPILNSEQQQLVLRQKKPELLPWGGLGHHRAQVQMHKRAVRKQRVSRTLLYDRSQCS